VTTSFILWNIFLGALGIAYLSYAKTQKKVVPMVGGLALLVVPYLTSESYYYLLTLAIVLVGSYKFNY